MFRHPAGAWPLCALLLVACTTTAQEIPEVPDRFAQIHIPAEPPSAEPPRESPQPAPPDANTVLEAEEQAATPPGLGERSLGSGVGAGKVGLDPGPSFVIGTKGGGGHGIGGLGTSGYGKGGGGTAHLSGSRGIATGHGILPPAPASTGPARSESYDNPGVNGFVAAAEDAKSTFSVDVDAASWTRTRRQLRDGYLPPNAMVRVEEFVNYFPYDYPVTEEPLPFSVHFEAAPSPFHPDRTVARIGLQARKVSLDDRRPVHLTFLVDTSCSMTPADRIDLVKESLHMLAGELDEGDTLGIVTYAGDSRVILPPTSAARTRKIKAAIDSLHTGGSTAMAKGLLTAYELADRSFVDGHVNRVIVASDGDANVGPTSPDALVASIRDYARKGITLTTLGFGTGNYRDHRMERLANEGDGNYYYVDGRAEARRVLVDRLRSTLEVVAKDVKLQVAWDPAAVRSYRLVGYENRDIADQDFRNDAVDAGEVGAGHQVTAVYELELVPGADAAPGALHLRWKAPGPDAPAAEHRYSFGRDKLRSAFSEASQDLRIAVSAAWFAEILRDSPHARDTSLATVGDLARAARRAEYSEDAELIELIDTARRLGGDGVASR